MQKGRVASTQDRHAQTLASRSPFGSKFLNRDTAPHRSTPGGDRSEERDHTVSQPQDQTAHRGTINLNAAEGGYWNWNSFPIDDVDRDLNRRIRSAVLQPVESPLVLWPPHPRAVIGSDAVPMVGDRPLQDPHQAGPALMVVYGPEDAAG